MNYFNKIRKYYNSELDYFKNNLLKYFCVSIGIFILGIIISFISFQGNEEKMMEIFTKIAQSFKEKGFDNLAPEILSIRILFNNVEVAIMILFLSLIPFIPIGLLICFLNGLIVGLIALVFYSKTGDIYLLLISLLPHGIIELSVIFYTSALGLLIWKKVNYSVLDKKNEAELSFTKILKCFFFIVLPLLFIAALIESFITPLFILK